MKNRIWVKFIVIYLLFAFVSVFALAAIVPEMTQRAIRQNQADSMYREATIISREYMEEYYSGSTTVGSLQKALESVSAYLESSIWLIDTEGNVLMSAGESFTGAAPAQVAGFNPGDFGRNSYMLGSFYGTFDRNMISVAAPITAGIRTAGYVLIHTPETNGAQLQGQIIRTTAIAFAVIFVLSLSLLAAYYIFVQRPMDQVVRAVEQYATGNLEYKIPPMAQDEMGYLANSLNRMSSRLNEADDAQKKFIANVSHDFRSPLTSIKGYSEAIADGTIPAELAPKYLNRIIFETERLTDLTTDLLTLSNLDQKDRKLDISDFDVVEIARRAANSCEDRCREKNIEIELVLAEKESIIRADRAKIQQVFYNLIDNAIKFSSNDSTITIETTRQTSRLLVSIQDEGVGIPEDALEKIWERFYKLDVSRGKDKKGTGLGLAIVHEILVAHGQNIICESTEGVGTKFLFTLPLAK